MTKCCSKISQNLLKMATFKVCVFKHHLKKDGTFNVKLRVIHQRETRLMSTPYNVETKYVTSALEIKDPEILGLCEDLCYDCRKICRALGFTIDRMNVDELIVVLLSKLRGEEKFRLDFCQFWSEKAETLTPGSRKNYLIALRALQRFAGSDSIDINQVTTQFVRRFKEFLEQEPSRRGANRKKPSGKTGESKTRAISLYLTYMKAMFNRAKVEFNDDDLGVVPISRAPFSKIKITEHTPTKRSITPEFLQRIIDLPYKPDTQPGARRYNLAKDCFLLSFCLIGMNSADLYSCSKITNGVLTYQRQKTRSRRANKAEMHVCIEPMIAPLIEKYKDFSKDHQFRFHRDYASSDIFNCAINKGLKMIAVEVELSSLQFYAARHTWATVARSRQVNIEKATVLEALNHADPQMRVTDIYIDRDWEVIWAANRKVLGVFRWEA